MSFMPARRLLLGIAALPLIVHLLASASEPSAPIKGKGAPLTEATYRALPNLLSNPSFEMDWMNNRVTDNTRFQLLEQSDWGYAQGDGLPDCWVLSPASRLDPATARFGKASLRLQGKASQVVYLCGETDPHSGGAFYNPFRPLPAALAEGLRSRPLRFGVWCKTRGATAQPSFGVSVEFVNGDRLSAKTFAASFAPGTHDWEHQEIVVPADAAPGLAHAAVVSLTFPGQGTAWFDGAFAVEDAGPDEINLLPNGGFETLDKKEAAGWSAPVLWTWSRSDYYRFTGWSHDKGRMAGGAAVVPFGRNGGHALQLTLLPGDNLAVKSRPVVLNQIKARPLEVSAWVRADQLRWLEIMAQDEKGQWLPHQDFAGFWGSDAQYRNRVIGIGSHDWEFVRKHFAPAQPVKELTLWLCARGMDGQRMRRNLVGTVWFDDVNLRERGTPRTDLEKRGVKIPTPAPPSPSPLPYRIVDLDLGERLWGQNEMRMRVQNPSDAAVTVEPDWPLRAPSGERRLLRGQPTSVPARGEVEVVVPYRLTELCAGWQQQYGLERPWPMHFGTPPSPLAVRLGASYLYPEEKLDVGINLHIARASLKDVASCQVVVRHPGGEKALLRTDAILRALWTPEQDQPALLAAGHVSAQNLLVLSVDGKDLPVHASTDPVRDCRVVVTLQDRGGKVIATQTSEPFGFLEKPPAPLLPDKIKRTEVNKEGAILVNGKPFTFNCFPYTATDLGGVSRMLNFPRTHKVLPLPFPKELLFKPHEEAGWKKKVQDFIKAHKDDPKLFGYFFQHDGETTFWLKEWKEMAACQRKVAAWAREIDPNRVLLSAEWLFGHGGLTPETAKPFDFLDVLDVEPGLTWTPDSNAVRRAAGRPVAVIAGLECYYFQPVNVLRWRVYEALRQGANGIGICPSGMLHPKPETISYLRGLYAEVLALQGMLAGTTPASPARASSGAVSLWEKQDGRVRYVVALLGDAGLPEKERRVRFTLPVKASKVEVCFEGRNLPVQEGQFTDPFTEPFTVRVYRVVEE